jgi:hypothetical protein
VSASAAARIGGGSAARAAEAAPEVGQQVFRVWGRDPANPDLAGSQSGPWGAAWTRVDPRTVANYRGAAGLPNGTCWRSTRAPGPCRPPRPHHGPGGLGRQHPGPLRLPALERALLPALPGGRLQRPHPGPVGVGKTMLANCLGHIAARRQHSVLMFRSERPAGAVGSSGRGKGGPSTGEYFPPCDNCATWLPGTRP